MPASCSDIAILNLDWMDLLIDGVKDTAEGQNFISNCTKWNEAIHKADDRPLTIFTYLGLEPGSVELNEVSPFGELLSAYGGAKTFDVNSPGVRISPQFVLDQDDILLRKTRWAATTGSNLEQILRVNNVKTAILVSVKRALVDVLHKMVTNEN